jgi:hypothetical protein
VFSFALGKCEIPNRWIRLQGEALKNPDIGIILRGSPSVGKRFRRFSNVEMIDRFRGD